MERFPSGQREQTVNLLSVTSVVRIHPSPPRKSTSQDVLFSCFKRVDLGYFSQNSRTLCVPNHLSVLTLVLLNKFSTALLNESTPLHHEKAHHKMCFFRVPRVWILAVFLENSRTLCVPNHLSVLTASKERCKRLHLQISRAADIDGGCTHRVHFCKATIVQTIKPPS